MQNLETFSEAIFSDCSCEADLATSPAFAQSPLRRLDARFCLRCTVPRVDQQRSRQFKGQTAFARRSP
jgi:hypothetical protein